MTKKFKLLASTFLILPLGFICGIACSKNSSGEFNKNQMFTDTVNNMIIPSYRDITSQAVLLKEALDIFAENPSDTSLIEAQEAWKEARHALKKAEIISFGPFVNSKFKSKMDFWPTRVSNINAAIVENTDFPDSVLNGLGTSVAGLPAMEFLLFSISNQNSEVLTLYINDVLAPNRKAFLKALASQYLNNAQTLEESWTGVDADFSQSFTEAGIASSLYPTQQSAISEMVNQMAFLVEAVKDIKLGKPMGKQSGGEPSPELIESPYSHNSIADMIANLEGLKLFYNGSHSAIEGKSLYSLMSTKDFYLAGLVNSYIDDAIDALNAITLPLDEAIILAPQQTEEAFTRLIYLKASIQTYVSGLLGVTPYFSDNDGD